MLVNNFRNKRIVVMGLGLFGGGVGLTRFLTRQGARIIVTDLRPPKELKESLRDLASLKNIAYHLGGHHKDDFRSADLIVVNPAVPSDSPYLKIARQARIPLETEMNLFFKLCPCPIIGITGSNGKTTTTVLLSEMLKKSGRTTWLGGNIGRGSLLEKINTISSEDIAVLELSSFQLDDLKQIKMSPFISLVLNIQPNHLDRHRTMRNYINAKKNIIRYQTETNFTVLNYDDAEVRNWSRECQGKVFFFSQRKPVSQGAYLTRGRFYLRTDSKPQPIGPIQTSKLLGNFNYENILGTITVAGLCEVPAKVMRQTISSFRGVEHRLELVRKLKGVKYYNDSIATNPESTIAALKAMAGPVILMAGGYDKQLPLDSLTREIVRRVKCVILLGATAGKIRRQLVAKKPGLKIIMVESLKAAVLKAAQEARKGDYVLLSPACASYDMFRNFAERGNLFKKLVRYLTP